MLKNRNFQTGEIERGKKLFLIQKPVSLRFPLWIDITGVMRRFFKTGLKIPVLLGGFCIIGTVLVFSGIFLSTPPSKPALTLLTYSSFGGVYGPARRLKAEFEKTCQCEIHFLLAEDSTGLLQRLQLKIPVDVVIGLDQIHLTAAEKFPWKEHRIPRDKLIPEIRPFQSPVFLPVDWAPIGWIYRGFRRKGAKSFTDIFSLKEKISFPEPEASTLGLQLYYWLYSEAGGEVITLKKFIKNLKTAAYGPITSWSLAYGVFRKGRVGMSLSYLTSLAYHRREEKDFSFRFAYFDRGHPWQVEFAAVPASCRKCSLALQFVTFLLTPTAQKMIRDSHFMFPVISGVKPEKAFHFKMPKRISYKSLPDFLERKEELFKIWRQQKN